MDYEYLDIARLQLARLREAYDHYRQGLEQQPDGFPSYAELGGFLEQLDATRRALSAFHADNAEANEGTATIPTRGDFDDNLNLGAMRQVRIEFAKRRKPVKKVREALAFVVTSPEFLQEFDQLPATKRFAFVYDLLLEADKLQDIEAGLALGDPGDWLPGVEDPQPAILSAIGDEHVLAPERLKAIADDLPFEVVEGSDGYGVQLPQGAPDSAKADVRKVVNQPTGDLTFVLRKLLGKYGDFLELAGPVLVAAEVPAKADRALVALYGKLQPFLELQGQQPVDIRRALEAKQEAIGRADKEFFARLGFPVSAALALIDIYLALRTLADPDAPTALQDAMKAVFIAVETVREGRKLLRITTTAAWRRVAIVATLALFVLDVLAAKRGFTTAMRYRDYSVAIGNLLLVGSAAASAYAGLAMAPALVGTAVVTGPVLIAIAVGLTLAFISQAIILWTRDTPLENYASVCMFGKDPKTSDSPGDVEYGFVRGGRWHTATQQERLRTLLNPLGFDITIPRSSLRELTHDRPTATGPSELRLPADTAIAVRLLESDGSANDWESTGYESPFVLKIFKERGSSKESSFVNEGLVGRWMEMEVKLPNAGPQGLLREFAQIP